MSLASTFEQQMLSLINQERQSRGLVPLSLELRLNDSSEDHSAWMQASGIFSHTGAGGSSATQRMQAAGFTFAGNWSSAENIAWQSERGAPGISDDVTDLHVALMNSPGHRANILTPEFRYIGIGIVEAPFGGAPDAVLVTQNFAATSAPVYIDDGRGIDGLRYIASYPDLIAGFGPNAAAGVAHYLAQGIVEGRVISFDTLQYIAANPDLIAAFGPAGTGAVTHYITQGYGEGRQTSFDALAYIATYADLSASFGTDAGAGLQHFLNAGAAEGRGIGFDGLNYIASHDDLIFAIGGNENGGTRHFIDAGRAEGRQTTFDPLQYIASHDDLVMALGADAEAGALHFIVAGLGEGRSRDSFDALQYLANYADLQAGFGSDQAAATLHYIQFGLAEGRTDDNIPPIADPFDMVI